MQPKSILIVLQTLDVGGTERQFVHLAEGLRHRGWQVGVFSVRGRGDLSQRLADGGITLYNDVPRRGADGWRTIGVAIKLYALLRRLKPLVVHGALPLPNFLAALAGRLAGRPVVVTSKRGLGTHQSRRWFALYLDWVADRLSDIITANSRAVRDDAERRERLAPGSIRVIPNGIALPDESLPDTRSFRREHGLGDGDLLLVCTAGFWPYKGHAVLLEAFARLRREGQAIRLVLIGGDRGNLAEIRSQATALGLDAAVLFLGLRDDVPALLPQMDVGVLASFEEGLSNALIEKLAAGLPVVATDVGGNAEILEGMRGCHLVEPRDAGALYEGLRAALAEVRGAPGQGALRALLTRERFSMERMLDSHVALYEERLAARGGAQ